MATKYFCDGCGKEHDINALTKVTVCWNKASYGEQTKTFDLDKYCLSQFQDNFPNKWPQHAAAAPPPSPATAITDEDIPF